MCDFFPTVYSRKAPHIGKLYSLINVVHHLVVAPGGVDFRHNARRQPVHQPAEQDAIPQAVLVDVAGRKLFPDHRFDPVLRFALLVAIPLAGDLGRKYAANSKISVCPLGGRSNWEFEMSGKNREI